MGITPSAFFDKIKNEWDDFFKLNDNSDQYFSKIVDIMKRLADFDLSVYRDRYIKGRIYHLLKFRQIPSIREYISIIYKNPLEIQKLKDLLTIHTTEFFRDLTPFRYLEKILLKRIADEIGDNSIPIRILSAPCSTGQEVYSLAIIADHLRKTNMIKNPIIIYGIDIDAKSIAVSREGIYRIDMMNNISFESIKTYFDICNDNRYLSVKQHIRSTCRFLSHDLFKPLPFNEKFNLVLCRNLLIYVSQEDQSQLMTNIKINTKRGGYIMLGNTEGVALMKETDFEVEDLEQRIYRYVGTKTVRTGIYRKPEVVRFIQPSTVGTRKSIAFNNKVVESLHEREIQKNTQTNHVTIDNPPRRTTLPEVKPESDLSNAIPFGDKPHKAPFIPYSLNEKPSQVPKDLDENDKDVLKRVQQVVAEQANERLVEIEKIIQRTKANRSQTPTFVDRQNEIENREKFNSVIERRVKEEESELKKIKKKSTKAFNKSIRSEKATSTPPSDGFTTQSKDDLVNNVLAHSNEEYDELERIVQKAKNERSNCIHINVKIDNVEEKNTGNLDYLLNNIYESAKKDVEEFEKTMEKRFKKLEPN